jgi:hypothetical protein
MGYDVLYERRGGIDLLPEDERREGRFRENRHDAPNQGSVL